MKNKKAISPLIATVLIIGFTIVLAAVVIQWGGQLVDRIKGQTDVTSDVSLKCSDLTQLEFSGSPTFVAGPPTTIEASIDNKNNIDIAGFVFRVYNPGGNVEAVKKDTATDNLDAFNVKKYTGIATAAIAATGLELGAVPIVTASDGSKVPCTGKEIKKAIV